VIDAKEIKAQEAKIVDVTEVRGNSRLDLVSLSVSDAALDATGKLQR